MSLSEVAKEFILEPSSWGVSSKSKVQIAHQNQIDYNYSANNTGLYILTKLQHPIQYNTRANILQMAKDIEEF